MKFKYTIKTLALACLMMMGVVAHAVPLVPGASFTGFSLYMTQGDFNGDGNMDIVESGSSANIRVSLADGQGGFTSLATQTLTGLTNASVALVYDMNGDGNADLLIRGVAGVYQANGVGDGTFSTPTQLFTLLNTEEIIDAVDMNGDNLIDFVGYDATLSKVFVVLATSTTTYAAPAATAAQIPTQANIMRNLVDVADINQDGNLDVVVQSNTTNQLEVFLGSSTGTLNPQPPHALPTFSGSPAYSLSGTQLVDLNNDNYPDYIVEGHDTTVGVSLVVLLNDGTGGFGTEVLYPLNGAQTVAMQGILRVADFNLDGKPDVLIPYHQKVDVFLGDGAGGFATPLAFSFTSQVGSSTVFDVVVGDINGDTKPDAVVKALDGAGFFTLSNFPLINMSTTSLITGTIAINAGAATTTSANVTLDLNCVTSTGVACASSTTMELSNDGGATWAPAAPWATSVPWMLPSGLGQHGVNVRFTDINGNISTANDTIEVVAPPTTSNNGCVMPSQSSGLYLLMLFGLLIAAAQMRSRYVA